MKASIENFILMALILALPVAASAQGRVPTTDSGAVIGEVGIFLPTDERLGSAPSLEGFYEYYFSPRTSVRMGLGWTKPEFDRDPEESFRYLRIPVDIVYNWEGGAIHPFAGAGIGVYILQLRDRGNNVGDSESKLGGTLFGGVEMFATRTLSVKGEARYHVVSDARGINPDGLALSVGLKKYF